MKFKEYLKTLNKLAETDPKLLEYETVAASDDEGNEFNIITFSPTTGFYEDKEFNQTTQNCNAVCVN